MKKIIISLLIVSTISACTKVDLSSNTKIISLNEEIVLIIDDTIYLQENTKVADVIANIKAEDDSKQLYLGVTNAKKEKTKDIFYEYEFLVVQSESKKLKRYYKISIVK